MPELLYSGYNKIVFSLNRNNVNIQNFKINLFKKIATSYICFEMTQICLCTRVSFHSSSSLRWKKINGDVRVPSFSAKSKCLSKWLEEGWTRQHILTPSLAK